MNNRPVSSMRKSILVGSTECLMATICIFPDLAQRFHFMIPTFIVSVEHCSCSAGTRSSLWCSRSGFSTADYAGHTLASSRSKLLVFSVKSAGLRGFSFGTTYLFFYFSIQWCDNNRAGRSPIVGVIWTMLPTPDAAVHP
jgi:hypothetical protein